MATPTGVQLTAFLAAERQTESGGNYTATNPAGGATGAYQFIQSTWNEYATLAGETAWVGKPAKTAPKAIQDKVAGVMATTYYRQYGTWSKVAQSWYAPADIGQDIVPYPTAGNTETVTAYGQSVVTAMNKILASATTRTPTTGQIVPAKQVLTTSTTTPATPYTSATRTTQTADGLAQIKTLLHDAGLTTLIPWATREVTQLAAQGMSAATISSQLSINLMTTQTPTVKATFDKKFPGMPLRQQNGYNAMSIAEYLTYENTAMQMARAAGIPSGFMTPTEIGKLIGNDVSTKELTERITQAFQVANTAAPETRQLLQSWYTIGKGTLAAYFLTPTKAEPLLVNAFTNNAVGKNGVTGVPSVTELVAGVTSALIGTAAKASGFATLSKTQAVYLQQMGVSQATARDTFKALAKLTPIMQALPGTGTEKTSLSENDLVNYGFFGTNQAEVSNVEQSRTAPFRGGGGPVMTQKGITGAGYGTAQGVTGT